MKRPLRSVLIGDVDFYPSELVFGVNQALTLAGHWHSTVNIRQDIGTIARRVAQMSPDVIFGHMLLWPPGGGRLGAPVEALLDLCADWRRRGARVLLHDGDARPGTRRPEDISDAVDLALCNHTADRSAWKIPQLRWPYFAFHQRAIADLVPALACDLAFAGRMADGPMYGARTRLVEELQRRLGPRMRRYPSAEMSHTLFQTPALAASAGAVLGYGRPDLPGWTDVRVFQYPGAGGVLLHDDAEEFLVPGRHYISYVADSAASILEALDRIRAYPHRVAELRRRAFAHVQAEHSATVRVRAALAAVDLEL